MIYPKEYIGWNNTSLCNIGIDWVCILEFFKSQDLKVCKDYVYIIHLRTCKFYFKDPDMLMLFTLKFN